MVILYSENFVSELENITNFIALHSEVRADDFMRELKSEIEKIPFMPYRFRKNLKQNRNDVREMIFKSYVVPFQIKKDSIIILSIFKCNLTRFS
ncbi:type II toxin-antitoxin system RelE/ParE family toxin [uncultured Campylobacter sp.]|uniref:type II toxin-antitoxin system RelE/ParE family toxin n=1 Tax=uncultured Campylobacter sp. TaxID=218934 RepID=UPI0026112851|nr:type II toxin-antitoxin system RelE/ParE family toxin [uncultured Campylobacter sp.]